MKAIAVHPGQAGSVHLRDIPPPQLDSVPGGRGVLVRLIDVGVDATDREINDALYGTAPPGDDFLVLGHESFGVIEQVGPNVKGLKPGDYVTATVRRPGTSIQDLIGTYDMTSDQTYYERGISLLHGFLTEYYVDDPEYIVRVPGGLKHLGVLMEPMSVAAKAPRWLARGISSSSSRSGTSIHAAMAMKDRPTTHCRTRSGSSCAMNRPAAPARA